MTTQKPDEVGAGLKQAERWKAEAKLSGFAMNARPLLQKTHMRSDYRCGHMKTRRWPSQISSRLIDIWNQTSNSARSSFLSRDQN